MLSFSGASGQSSVPDLVSIPIVFVTSTFNKLHTIYKGTPECQAESQIEKLQILFIVSQLVLIQSAHKNTLFMYISLSYKLSTKNAALLSVIIVSGTQAFTNSFEVFLH
jgi:hypothetical protein